MHGSFLRMLLEVLKIRGRQDYVLMKHLIDAWSNIAEENLVVLYDSSFDADIPFVKIKSKNMPRSLMSVNTVYNKQLLQTLTIPKIMAKFLGFDNTNKIGFMAVENYIAGEFVDKVFEILHKHTKWNILFVGQTCMTYPIVCAHASFIVDVDYVKNINMIKHTKIIKMMNFEESEIPSLTSTIIPGIHAVRLPCNYNPSLDDTINELLLAEHTNNSNTNGVPSKRKTKADDYKQCKIYRKEENLDDNSSSNGEDENIVDISSYDQQRITDTTMMLTDNEINAIQQILKHQFPYISGFFDPVSLVAKLKKNKDRFFVGHDNIRYVQILFDTNHWICVSNIFSDSPYTVQVYDSLYHPSRYIEPSPILFCLKRMLAGKDGSKSFKLEIMPVQLQKDMAICGILATAFAYELSTGVDPCSHYIETDSIRSHVQNCLVKNKFTKFDSRENTQDDYKITPTSFVIRLASD